MLQTKVLWSFTIGRVRVSFEWKLPDLWIGLFFAKREAWVCLLPCLPIHIALLDGAHPYVRRGDEVSADDNREDGYRAPAPSSPSASETGDDSIRVGPLTMERFVLREDDSFATSGRIHSTRRGRDVEFFAHRDATYRGVSMFFERDVFAACPLDPELEPTIAELLTKHVRQIEKERALGARRLETMKRAKSLLEET